MKRIHVNIPEDTQDVKGRRRDGIDLLRSRLNLLTGTDKVLMTMYVEHENSFRQIARVCGVSESNVARRINGIISRLTDGQYIACLRNRDKLNRWQLAVAKDYFLYGLSMRQIAAKRRRSYYRVREALNEIQNIVTASERRTGSC
jgi:predicted DNA-binding protein YlxM (UPF0122 family)